MVESTQNPASTNASQPAPTQVDIAQLDRVTMEDFQALGRGNSSASTIMELLLEENTFKRFCRMWKKKADKEARVAELTDIDDQLSHALLVEADGFGA